MVEARTQHTRHRGSGELVMKGGRFFRLPPGDSHADVMRVRDHWGEDKTAQNWAVKGIRKTEQDAIRNALIQSPFYTNLSLQSNILDLGVGSRSYINASLLPEQVKVSAVDLSEQMLQHLRKAESPLAVGYVSSKATALPFQDDIFDRVLTTLMMRYLTFDGQLEAIREMVRIARPGGYY